MRDTPPPALVELLGRLGLAAPAQVLAVQGRVKRLARGLPGFEQVWVDALGQVRVLTPFQAGEINAGRSGSLVVGPYVLIQPLESLGYAVSYRVREVTGSREVRLAVVPVIDNVHEAWTQRLSDVVRRSAILRTPSIEPVDAFGFHASRLWLSAAYTHGQSASDWMLHHGRFAPAAVCEIARQMLVGLCACETAGVLHGDISTRQLWLSDQGDVRLVSPGLRGAVRPGESYAQSDLPPETYDYLAPERIALGTPPTAASDMYACGVLWWQLLAGRAPIAGANGLAKMQAAQTGKIADISHLAPETPMELVEAIRDCTQHDPQRRPTSFAELQTRLGPANLLGQRTLARALDRSRSCRLRLGQAPEARSFRGRARRVAAIAVGCLLIVVAGTWPQWQPRLAKTLSQSVQQAPAKSAAAARIATTIASDVASPSATTTTLVGGTNEPTSPRATPGPWPGSFWENDDLVLTSEKPIEVSNVPLRKGQVIRARAGTRAAVHIGQDGWRIDADEVRLHNIDFFATQPGARSIVTVAAPHIEFHGCSWQGSRDSSGTAAIAWVESSEPGVSNDLLLCGELRLSDCLVQRVEVGIRREGRGAVLVELANVLHLGPGALVEVSDPPRGDDSLELIVSHVTLRDASALLLCRYDALPADPGQLIITAKDCALIPNADGGVVLFVGAAQPANLLRALEWTGHGSVVAQHAPLARWLDAEGVPHSAPDDAVSAAGIVRSDVGFAGEKTEGSAASRIVRWQVPLQSTEPPGIRESRPLPPGTLR